MSAWAGFALVFVVTVVTTSAAGVVVLTAARRRLARLGPMAERRAAEAVAIAPVVVAAIAVAALVVQAGSGVDHCEVHDHHAHLCFTHGVHWMNRAWVVAVLVAATLAFVVRAVIAIARYLRGARSVRALEAVSRVVDGVRIVDSELAFCFVAQRGVFVSSRTWSALPVGELQAVLAHERAHRRHGDLAARLVLEGFLLLAAPFAARQVLRVWLRASERMCDARAAAETCPETVAHALIAMCRLGAAGRATSFAFTPTVAELEARIEAVLAARPLGERPATVLVWASILTCLLLATAGLLGADPLHHAFETLLG